MNRFLVLLLLASATSGWHTLAAGPFPWWFHTRPKPVLVDQPLQSQAYHQNQTPARKTPVANPGAQRPVPLPANPQPFRQSWLARLFSRPAR